LSIYNPSFNVTVSINADSDEAAYSAVQFAIANALDALGVPFLITVPIPNDVESHNAEEWSLS